MKIFTHIRLILYLVVALGHAADVGTPAQTADNRLRYELDAQSSSEELERRLAEAARLSVPLTIVIQPASSVVVVEAAQAVTAKTQARYALRLSEFRKGDERIASVLKGFARADSIELVGCELEGPNLRVLADFTGLTQISVTDSSLSGTLVLAPRVALIRLQGVRVIGDDFGFGVAAGRIPLLTFKKCAAPDLLRLCAAAKRLTGVSRLTLEECAIDEPVIDAVAGITYAGLFVVKSSMQVSPAVMARVFAGKTMETFALVGVTGVDDAFVNDLPWGRIGYLVLADMPITAGAVDKIVAILGVGRLSLSGTNIGDAGAAAVLAAPRGLTEVGFDRVAITDAALIGPVAASITGINLSATGVTEAGLERLLVNRQIRAVNIKQTGITTESLARLRRSHPDVKFIY